MIYNVAAALILLVVGLAVVLAACHDSLCLERKLHGFTRKSLTSAREREQRYFGHWMAAFRREQALAKEVEGLKKQKSAPRARTRTGALR